MVNFQNLQQSPVYRKLYQKHQYRNPTNLQTQHVQAMLRLLVVLLVAAGFMFGLLRSFDLALSILTCRRALRCIGLGFVALGALAGFEVTVGVEGRLSPPGQALKTWTSFTLRPLSSGGLAQVARTFRLTFSIHLGEEKRPNCKT